MGNSDSIPSTRVVAIETPRSKENERLPSNERSSGDSPEAQLAESCDVSELSSLTRTKKGVQALLGITQERGHLIKTVCGISVSINGHLPMNCTLMHRSDLGLLRSRRPNQANHHLQCTRQGLNVLSSVCHTVPNIIHFTSHIFVCLCLHLNVQAANRF
jgi:hypothetical protein